VGCSDSIQVPLVKGGFRGIKKTIAMLISKNKAHIPYDPRLKERARELRKNMTPPEKKLWNEYLRNHRLSFLRQKPIVFFIADFYCSKARLVIEIDGDSHSDEFGKGYDAERTSIIKKYGLRVLRFANQDVLKRFSDVTETIEREIAIIPPGPPLTRGEEEK